MDPQTLAAILASCGLGAYVPLVFALIGVASAVSVIYPPTWPGAAYVHKAALLIRNASPAVPAAPPAPPSAKPAVTALVAVLVSAVILSACAGVPATLSPGETRAVQTLAGLAAAKNKTVAAVVADGALFCRKVGPLVPFVAVAVSVSTGLPVSVVGKAAEDVANTCAAVGGVPVPPPADPGAAPVAPVAPTA
jgi:hypothetical protein